MKITIAQLNPFVGDIEGNTTKAIDVMRQAAADYADLLIFPELYIIGYPPKDLLERSSTIKRVDCELKRAIAASRSYPDLGVIIGAPTPAGCGNGKPLYNSAILFSAGEILFQRHKSLLPSYDVFDEARYFRSAVEIEPVIFKNEVLGISICEDAWNLAELWQERQIYEIDPIKVLADKGATLMVNISASPFRISKDRIRFELVSGHARKHAMPFVFVNQVGGNDDLVFDGNSIFVDKDGSLIEFGRPFSEQLINIDTRNTAKIEFKPIPEIESVYEALVLGLRDYARKCGFESAIVGLSGGIDSSVVCCLAADAFGPERVEGISMPSQFTSPESIEDAMRLAHNLKVKFKKVPIDRILAVYLEEMKDILDQDNISIAEENLQARIRGNILMAHSNQFGHLVLSTGNKSELAVGYCTLYGDMSGGLSVISDVPKTMVYRLAAHINSKRQLIPDAILTKPPSAELRPGQLDQDSLPPYELLDQILNLYVEENLSVAEIIDKGFETAMVDWVTTAVDRNEYKRKQAPPGLKVTSKAFGAGRRMPIAAKH